MILRALCWLGLHDFRRRRPARVSHFTRCARCRHPGIVRRASVLDA